MSVNIIGLSCFYHDAACCLLQDGFLKAAAQEERFSKMKFDPGLPKNAFRYCLEAADLDITDIDCIAYYENPEKKLARQLWSGIDLNVNDLIVRLDPHGVEKEIRQNLGFEGKIIFCEHHLSHAASSFYFSGFESAAILTVDGVGEWATTTYGRGEKEKIELFEEVHFPDSLGLLYSTITSYLGFKVNNGEYKVMGLAPYGQPKYANQLKELIELDKDGQYRLRMEYFDFLNGKRMYSPEFSKHFGQPARVPESELLPFHKDLARSLQFVLEEILLQKVNYLHKKTNAGQLCMAGGVALNCVANERILRDGPFKELFVQPAAGDGGGCLGAAAMAHIQLTGERPNKQKLSQVFLGPGYSDETCHHVLKYSTLKFHDYRGKQNELLQEIAKLLAQGKVIGWFQGRMEFGPRALGARSILADPRDASMRKRINAMVKKREGFRPFAPAVLNEKKEQHFVISHPSPFMLETCPVKSPIDLPAITHLDNSARIQTVAKENNPLFAALLEEFDRITGCPILLNTSFNVRGQPIVCTPEDALKCFISTDIDGLALGSFLLLRNENSFDVLEQVVNQSFHFKSAITHDLYTFI